MPTSPTKETTPTWYGDVRHFFDPIDVEHMKHLGVDLATYGGVKSKAVSIYQQTVPPNAAMPPSADRKWSQERSDAFMQWIVAGYPLGTPSVEVPEVAMKLAATSAPRMRKNAADLTAEELGQLKAAFQGIMDLPPTDPNSFFVQAGYHWYPAPLYCLHHENRYNPWHRTYMASFENALRSVPGCEDVTLPYWDIESAPPDFLFEAPFASYTLPEDIGPGYAKGYTTKRYDAQTIMSNVASYGIPGLIQSALASTTWERFDSFIIQAHDAGHVSTGPTMAVQNVAAFDPIFFFFHANWDRLWWKWQQEMRATTLRTFLSTVTGPNLTWIQTPPFNDIPPFDGTVAPKRNVPQTIDLTASFDVDYVHPTPAAVEKEKPVLATALAARPVRISDPSRVSVDVEGVDRHAVPGSFTVHLLADGERIAKKAFFQPNEPQECATCRKQAHVDFSFPVALDTVQGKTLGIEIEPVAEPVTSFLKSFPLARAGNPTITVRHLLHDE